MSVAFVPLRKKSLLKYLPLVLELLELLIDPFKLFPVIHYEKEGDKRKTPGLFEKVTHGAFLMLSKKTCWQRKLLHRH